MTQAAYSAQQQVNEALADGVHQEQPNLSFNQQEIPNLCPNCKNLILPNFKFCPKCGKQLGETDISVGKQIYIYFMSIGLPPLGLYWGIKYAFNPKTKIKIIGAVAAILTIVSLIVTTQLVLGFFSQVQSLYQDLPSGQVPSSVSSEIQLFNKLQK